jgi:hypothetical protein
MAFSSIIIDFDSVPSYNDVLNIQETSLSLDLNEIFKDLRYEDFQVELPYFEPDDGFHGDRYYGSISEKYKNAFNADYNGAGLFTVTSTNGPLYSGVGIVTITANFPGAVFVLGASTSSAIITINNEAPVTPPPATISFSPNTLAFEHSQNGTLPSFGIAFAGDLWKIVGKPHFLLSSATPGVTITTTGSGASLYQTISGSGAALVNIALTNYFDSDIIFSGDAVSGAFNVYKDNVLDGTISYTVEVSRLSDFLTIPYASGQKAFTLDTKYFTFASENENTYFQFDALIKTYDFFSNVLNEITVNQKIVLFKGQQKAILGQLIHRLMRRFQAPNDTLLQYKEATVKITCSEKLLSNDSVIRSGISAEIPFLAGLSKQITNLGFLDFNPVTNRVTKNSFAYLNFITPSGNYELRTFKNGTQVGTAVALPASTGIVFCKKVTFSNYNQGDYIQFVIDKVGETNGDAPKKSFVLFPEGNYSNHIVWENEFLLESAIECTGTASIIPEGEFQSQTIYQDLVEKLVNISSSKNVRLNINTGWLSMNDIDTVESLMRAKRAWLIQGNSFINLVPTSKKLPERDLQTELIQFSLEFKINQTYNEETYSL